MYVSPKTLDLHLVELKRRFELVHLDDWLSRSERGAPLPRLACAITFDDGWRDNFEFALPVLRKHGTPAMIFLVANLVGSDERFWPNRLMNLLRTAFTEPKLVDFPEPLRLIVEPVLESARAQGKLTADHANLVVERAKSFDESAVRSLIASAEKGEDEYAEGRDLLSQGEVTQMSATGLVRFGCHTATHYRLGSPAPKEDLEREIVHSKARIQEYCGHNVSVFCYPNGETSADAVRLVRQHYLGAVTTRRGWHSPYRDPHLVRRIGVHEEMSASPESFLARLSAWM